VRSCGQGGDKFATAADPELVENRVEVLLEGVGRYVELFDDGGSGPSLQDQRDDAALGGGEAVGGQD
jgi:hypothetical protein